MDFRVGGDGVLRLLGKGCILEKKEIKRMIFEEGHKSCLSVHLGMTKLYKYLKQLFWWADKKRDVAKFVALCLTCQKVKVEYQRPGGML